MKIIKFKQKKNQKIYFINQEELINHLGLDYFDEE